MGESCCGGYTLVWVYERCVCFSTLQSTVEKPERKVSKMGITHPGGGGGGGRRRRRWQAPSPIEPTVLDTI
jgi:hypothetical protein